MPFFPIPTPQNARWATVGKLGCAAIISYGSTLYLPAILGQSIAQGLGLQTSTVFLAFSLALLTCALCGPLAGRLIDVYGGRKLMAINNLVFAAGLLALASAQGVVSLIAAWVLIGMAMAAGFYEAAFATVVRLYGSNARSAITGITLVGGFASTIAWPFTAWLDNAWGWRVACMVWAAIHLLVALPLNLWLPKHNRQPVVTEKRPPSPEISKAQAAPSSYVRSTTALLVLVFACTAFVGTAMAAHLPRLLQAHGVTLAASIAFASFVGPAQVVGRMLEYGALRNINPLISARLASVLHTVGAALFLALGVPAAAVFTLLHGAGIGVMTVANGTLPLLFFGAQGYGQRQGMLMLPARFAQASAPFLFGLAMDAWGAQALYLSAGVGMVSLLGLLMLRSRA